jgi:hypothetical protein
LTRGAPSVVNPDIWLCSSWLPIESERIKRPKSWYLVSTVSWYHALGAASLWALGRLRQVAVFVNINHWFGCRSLRLHSLVFTLVPWRSLSMPCWTLATQTELQWRAHKVLASEEQPGKANFISSTQSRQCRTCKIQNGFTLREILWRILREKWKTQARINENIDIPCCSVRQFHEFSLVKRLQSMRDCPNSNCPPPPAPFLNKVINGLILFYQISWPIIAKELIRGIFSPGWDLDWPLSTMKQNKRRTSVS